MKLFKKFIIILLVFLSLGTTSSCKFTEGKRDPSTFNEYTYSLVPTLLGEDELTLHWLFRQQEDFGFEANYEPSLPTPSNGGSLLGTIVINAVFGQVKTYDYSQLDFDQRMTYNILVDLLDNINNKTSEMSYLSNNYLGSYLGYQAQLPLLFSEYKFYDKIDVETYFKFMDLVPTTFKEYVDYEIEKADNGYGMPDFVIDKVINQCVEFVSDAENHFLIKTFDERLNSLNLTEAERANYIKTNKEKVLGSLCEGYNYVRDNLPQIKGRATNNLGLAHYEIGKDYYKLLFTDATGYDMPIEDAIKYVDEKMTLTINKIVSLQSSKPGISEKVAETSLMTITPEEQMEAFKTLIGGAFPTIDVYPNINIKYIDESMENHFSPAAYMTSPLDDYENEFIYLNNAKIDGDYNYLYTTLAHEGIPGHMYQNIYFKTLENANPIRKILKSSGYTEGWATYAELYSYNFFNSIDEDVLQYLKLYDELNGILTARLDLGIHYEGWTINETLNYLQKYFSGYTYEAAQRIFEQLVEVPTNSQQYFFTYFKLVDMHDRAKNALGSNFDPIEFHKLILDCGPVPLRFIETEVDNYIANKKGQ